MSQALSNVQKLRDIVDASLFLTPAQVRDVKNRTGLLAVSTALTAGLASAASAGASDAYFQSGNWTLDGTGVQITSPIILRGAGPQKTILRQTNATGNGVTFDYVVPSPGISAQGGGLVGMTVEAGAGWQSAGFQGSGSTGVGVEVRYSLDLFLANDISVNNFDYGVAVKGCFGTHWLNTRILYATHRGLSVDKYGSLIGADNQFIAIKVSNLGFTGTNTGSRGVDIVNSGGDVFIDVRVTSMGNAWVIAPQSGDQVLYCHFTNCFGDASLFDNWTFDGSVGLLWETTCTACWGAFSTNGSGLSTDGANLVGLQWIGGQLRENGRNGWVHGGGSNVQLDGVRIVHNSKLTTNTYAGVAVAGGVSEWALRGCRVGNDGSSTIVQADGLSIGAGVSENFIVTGNDFRDPGAGKVPVAIGSTLLNWIIGDNLPLQTVGVNPFDAIPQSFSATAAAAGSTVSMGRVLLSRAAVAPEFTVSVDAAPGIGQTFTYTVWINGASTTMTGVISGTDTTLTVTSNPQVLTKAQFLELKVVTSAGAAVTNHFACLLQQP